MPVETTYTNLREHLASVLDQVATDQEVVIVRRRGAKDVALVPAEELSSLMETAHLLRSPRNARRLLLALQRAAQGKGKPGSVDELRREMGLEHGPSNERPFSIRSFGRTCDIGLKPTARMSISNFGAG